MCFCISGSCASEEQANASRHVTAIVEVLTMGPFTGGTQSSYQVVPCVRGGNHSCQSFGQELWRAALRFPGLSAQGALAKPGGEVRGR